MENKELLDTIKKGKWIHVRKTAGIWVKKLDVDTVVETLEGTEMAKAGDFLCKGIKGEVWPQREEDVLRKYKPTGIREDGFRKYQPLRTCDGLLAVKIKRPFVVSTSWGTQTGKAGDFLLKNYADRKSSYPVDIWVVDGGIFWATYSTVVDPRVADIFMAGAAVGR